MATRTLTSDDGVYRVYEVTEDDGTTWVDAEPYTPGVYEATIRAQAQTALTANRTFLAITTPTNAQNAAQIKALTRQNQGIIRLLLGQLDGSN